MRIQTERKAGLKVGCQSYWSSHPLVVELERSTPGLSFVRDDCAGLFRRLEAGEVDYAFCSSISLLRNNDFEMAFPLGVSHRGPGHAAVWGLSNAQAHVLSYIHERTATLREQFRATQLAKTENLKQGIRSFRELFLATPVPRLELVPLMRMSTGSSSWSCLSRLLYRLIFGVDAYNSLVLAQNVLSSPQDLGDDGIELRIENDALQKRCSFPHVVDLAQVWREITGLPFVSTILQKNRRFPEVFAPSRFSECLELAQMRMQVEPCTYYPDILPRNTQQQAIDLCTLWKGLGYRLDHDDLRSLLIFLYFCKPLEKKSLEDEVFTLKMLRWQQRENALHSL